MSFFADFFGSSIMKNVLVPMDDGSLKAKQPNTLDFAEHSLLSFYRLATMKWNHICLLENIGIFFLKSHIIKIKKFDIL